MRRRLAVFLLLLFAPSVASAQVTGAASPVNDVLDRMTADVNDLRYADARRRGQPFAASVDALPLAQRVRWHLLMAAAFYPFEQEHQHPDSAMTHLRALIRIAPDARFAPEMRWRGLDSLLDNARERTLAAVVRGPLTQRVAGSETPGRVDIVATRKVRARIAVIERATGRVLQSDTATSDRPTLTLLAHDGRRVLLSPGELDLVLTAWDATAPEDSITSTYALTVEGRLPALRPEPPLPAAALLPEHVSPSRRRFLTKGIVYSALTLAVATLARNDATLRDEFPIDARAVVVGGTMVAGVSVMLWREKERPIPANIASNAAARAEHERRIGDVISANRGLLTSYAVTARIAPEPR